MRRAPILLHASPRFADTRRHRCHVCARSKQIFCVEKNEVFLAFDTHLFYQTDPKRGTLCNISFYLGLHYDVNFRRLTRPGRRVCPQQEITADRFVKMKPIAAFIVVVPES